MTQAVAARYTPHHELANALTHAIGAALSVAAMFAMVMYASAIGDAYRIVSVTVFGASMISLYVASTCYHVVSHPEWKTLMRLVDHVCIYILIAGTYTPFTLVSIRGGWGWSLFGVTWGLALAGIVFKIFFVGRLEVLSVLVYIGMGWLGVIAIRPVLSALPPGGILWLVTGGVMYTLGVAFYSWRRVPFHHAIWHLFVMAGTSCHFAAVYWYVLPVS